MNERPDSNLPDFNPPEVDMRMRVQARSRMDQRNAELRDGSDKVEVTEEELQVLTTLASLSLSYLITVDRGAAIKLRERALALLRVHIDNLRSEIGENGQSVLSMLFEDGAALLAEDRLGKYAIFHKSRPEGKPE